MGGKTWLAGLLVPLLLVAACGEVTTSEDAGLCAEGACDAGDSGAPGTAGVDRHKKMKGNGVADAAAPHGLAPTTVDMLPCELCVRAEACCKAGGGTDCNYTAACVAAMASEQQFYVALCRAILHDSAAASKKPTDICGS